MSIKVNYNYITHSLRDKQRNPRYEMYVYQPIPHRTLPGKPQPCGDTEISRNWLI